MKTTVAFAFFSLAFCLTCPAQAVSFDWATVGNPGNAPDTEIMDDGTTGYGSVDYIYRISKHEVTNAQYVEFLAQGDNGFFSGLLRCGLKSFITVSRGGTVVSRLTILVTFQPSEGMLAGSGGSCPVFR